MIFTKCYQDGAASCGVCGWGWHGWSMMYDTAHMSACIVLLCNARHNVWRWAICITLCNHRNVFIAFEAVWLV